MGERAGADRERQAAEGEVYGYARVSSVDQNLNRQLDALRAFPVAADRIFEDKTSGKDFNRPGYRRLMRTVGPGDVIVVQSIDRLGRNYREILDEWRTITQVKEAQIVVIDMPLLDTRTAAHSVTGQLISDIVLQLLSCVAQVDREHIKQRQAEGIASAKARGVRFGRPRIPLPPQFDQVRGAVSAGRMTRAQAARALGVSASTFDRWVRRERLK